MTGRTKPRHAHKEVREVFETALAWGFEDDGEDSRGHSVLLWAATGKTVTLPTTPRGNHWRDRTLRDAARIAGQEWKSNKRKGGKPGHLRVVSLDLRAAKRERTNHVETVQAKQSAFRMQQARRSLCASELSQIDVEVRALKKDYLLARTPAEKARIGSRCNQLALRKRALGL